MKSVLLRFTACAFLFSFSVVSAFGQIWMEDFDSYPDGTDQFPPKWTTMATDCDDGGATNLGPGASQFGVWAGEFAINDIEGSPCCSGGIDGGGNGNYWTTEMIDISNDCDVFFTLETAAVGNMECDSPGSPIFGCTGNTPPDNSHDQMVIEYQIDGGGWNQAAYICAANGIGPIFVGGLNGNTLQIRVSAANKSNSEYYYFDNVVVDGSSGSPATFAQIGPLCETDAPVSLPGTSNEGVTGSWDAGPNFDPSGQGGNTVTINFTPDAGQCASPATMDITVNAATTPVLPSLGPYCTTDPAVNLPTDLNGITGNWSGGGIIGNVFDPSSNLGSVAITFTPEPGQCATSDQTTITVNQAATPALGTASICESDPPIDLTPLQDPSFPGGSWSGPGVSGNNFSPSGQNGPVNITFTPSAPCAQPAMTTITVSPTTMPTLGTASMCETDPPIDLTSLQDPSFPSGSWSGAGVSGNSFSPSGLNGNVFITFTPTAPCAQATMTTVDVIPAAMPALGTATLCENDPPIDLTPLQDPSFPSGSWSGPGVAGNFFNPSGQSGPVNITFTPSGNCEQPAMTTITVDQPTMPILDMATVCQTAGFTDLISLQDPSFPTGTWSGPGVVGSLFDPSGQSGPVMVTFTSDQPCTQPALTTITVDAPASPILAPATICETEPFFDLTPLQDPSFSFGIWSGPGVTASPIFTPTGLSGPITLTFTPVGGCSTSATTTVTVEGGATPTLAPVSLCSSDPIFDLTIIQDPLYPTGTWDGLGVSGNQFDPSGLSGPVDLLFTPVGNCVSPGMTTITVTESGSPMLGTASVCQTDNLFNLSTLNDPNYPAGTWSGPGVSGGNFDPSGQSGPVTLTFDPNADCAMDGQTTITVSAPAAPILGMASICASAASLDLTTLQDPAFPAGTWAGPGVSGGSFSPSGQNGGVVITFTPDTDCSLTGQTTVTVDAPPSFSGLSDDCNPATQEYTISFNISGGTAPYTVNGSPVSGTTFTSTSIASGTPYSFQLDDANGCGPVTISGTVNCSCATDAGTMDFTGTPLLICADSDIPINFNNDEMLDADDVLAFVIHDAAGTTLGTVLATAAPPATSIPNPGLATGQTYYLSAVAASDNGSGSPDLTDPCLSVAQGIPFEIYEPAMNLSATPSLCAEQCTPVTMTFTEGVAPFSVIYEVFVNGGSMGQFSQAGLPATSTFPLCLMDFGATDGTFLIDIVSIADGAGCMVDGGPSQTINILPAANALIDPTLCPGESMVVNGTEYDMGNPTGMETLTGSAFNGCDSIIEVNLSFFPSDTNFIVQTLCTGSSLTVNGTIYNAANPDGTEVLPAANVDGCDSVIVVDLTFNSQVTSNLNPTLCPGDSVVVNGTTYNAAMPNGTETFPMGSYLGCDSTVVIGLSFFPAANGSISPEVCAGGSVTIGGVVFDAAMPTGTVVLPNASVNGCDSNLSVSLQFSTAVFANLTPTLCPGESVTVNGTVYDEAMPNGSETFPLGSYLGCDSTVIIGLIFSPIDTFFLNENLCTGGSMTVNGTVYNEAMPSGIEVLPGADVNGCDSVISVNLSFSAGITFDLDSTLCVGESLTVNGTVYDGAMPTGAETFAGGSYLGCDSTVNVSLSFFPVDTNFIMETLCTGGSLTVNGTAYDEATPSGIEVLPGANVNGCDSVISVSLSFDSEVFGTLDTVLCAGASITVNGTVYSELNPAGAETFPGGSYQGCDSTVNVSLGFVVPTPFDLTQTLCTGASMVVNGSTYNEAMPSGTEILAGQNYLGCDSVVNVSLNFVDEVFADLDPELCAGESITVNGTVYDEDNSFGEETFVGGSFFGCDSTVIVDLNFTDPVVADFTQTLCTGGSVTVNGTVYDESNPTGVEILQNAAQNGCDSTVNVSLFFDSSVSADLDTTLCPGGQIFVNGTLYFEGNATGAETYPGGSYLGCDSTVNVSLSFFPEALLQIDSMMAFGQTLMVNGTVYSQSSPTGVEIIPGGSASGCDSTVLVNLTYDGSFEVVLEATEPTCQQGTDGSIRIDTIVGGMTPFLVSLNGGADTEIAAFPFLFNNLNAGFYTLTVRDALGEIVSENLLIDNPPPPQLTLGNDREVQLGQGVSLSPSANFNPVDYLWSPSDFLDCTDCDEVRSTPETDITYVLTVTTPDGCTVSDDIALTLVKNRSVFAPDAFSPNADGLNDGFTLFAGPQVTKINRLLIFDRWGALVFEHYNFPPNDTSLGWDGEHNGEDMNPAVFVWFAEVEFLDGQVELFEGGVHLVR